MKLNNNSRANIGIIGENIACSYLVKKGHKIVDRNFRRKFGEIDVIVLSSDGTLVFCEVKTMIEKIGFRVQLAPEDNLTFKKAAKMKKIAGFYAARNPDLVDDNKGWRIDLVVIVLGENFNLGEDIKRITHYENI